MRLHHNIILSTLLFSFAFGFVIPGRPRLNILLSNDDGWAEANLRALYTSLNRRGHNVLELSRYESDVL